MPLSELENELTQMGEKKFRATQIFEWLHRKRVQSFDKMTNLSMALRQTLARNYHIASIKAVKVLSSETDDTKKFLFELEDQNHIETVLMNYEHGYSLCVSSQVGCKMGCKFCASTIAGFKRSLLASEILLQLYEAERITGVKVSSIVLMGIGEPLDNFDNVIKFLNILSDKNGTNMSLRHVSLSTCGLVDKIYELSKFDLGITLSISLHAANDEKRSELMPVNRKYNIASLMKACYDYFDATGRRISFEYALIDGENDSKEDAKAIAALVKGMPSHVNVIPVNKIKERSFTSDRAAAHRFCGFLNELGVNATVRRTLGSDIDAACGQLRREYEI